MRLLLAAMSLVLVAACGSQDGSEGSEGSPSSPTTSASSPSSTGPAASVEQLMRALDAGDCTTVRSLVVTPSAVDCGDVANAQGSFADEGTDLDTVTYQAGPVEGTSASVTINWGNDNPDETYDVEQVDGTWLVVFDSVA